MATRGPEQGVCSAAVVPFAPHQPESAALAHNPLGCLRLPAGQSSPLTASSVSVCLHTDDLLLALMVTAEPQTKPSPSTEAASSLQAQGLASSGWQGPRTAPPAQDPPLPQTGTAWRRVTPLGQEAMGPASASRGRIPPPSPGPHTGCKQCQPCMPRAANQTAPEERHKRAGLCLTPPGRCGGFPAAPYEAHRLPRSKAREPGGLQLPTSRLLLRLQAQCSWQHGQQQARDWHSRG
ncbi:unnamed protein product [Natator depressus]